MLDLFGNGGVGRDVGRDDVTADDRDDVGVCDFDGIACTVNGAGTCTGVAITDGCD